MESRPFIFSVVRHRMRNSSEGTLPRAVRLRGHQSFSRIFSEGQGLRRGQIVAKFRTTESDKRVVVGFVVRRSAGSAVRRNRLRRLLREAYRLQRQHFETAVPEAVDVEVILMWAGTAEQALRPKFADIRVDIESALRKLVKILGEQVNAPAA